ncbi:hypothetical protein Y032_0274g1023 [Ancylostoma ceylanicum]|uniref:Uncharacterized protein n=1 Tax=Ancylostoma ceylanicum TaxID=53326 RepID=A0A016S7S3_9BILA|nr:hypothetical protein Y032_0274g1023 [Ancylostoma ceylanicum]
MDVSGTPAQSVSYGSKGSAAHNGRYGESGWILVLPLLPSYTLPSFFLSSLIFRSISFDPSFAGHFKQLSGGVVAFCHRNLMTVRGDICFDPNQCPVHQTSLKKEQKGGNELIDRSVEACGLAKCHHVAASLKS